MKGFYETLFNAGEMTCHTTAPEGTAVTPVDPSTRLELFTLNPLIARRSDSNVTSLRSLVLEFDDGLTAAEQIERVKAKGLPFTAAVWSGNKSVHFIITLEEPLDSMRKYAELFRHIHSVFPMADPSTKNPSRLTRAPSAIRASTGQEQTLLELNGRVPRSTFAAWLKQFPAPAPKRQRVAYTAVQIGIGIPKLHPLTQQFLREGAPEGRRHFTLFCCACDYARKGIAIDQAAHQLLRVWSRITDGSRTDEFEKALDDAYQTVAQENLNAP